MKTKLLSVLMMAAAIHAYPVTLNFSGKVTESDPNSISGFGVGSVFYGTFSFDPDHYNAPNPDNRGHPALGVTGGWGTSIALNAPLRFIDGPHDLITFGGEAMPDNWVSIRLEDYSGTALSGYQAPDHLDLSEWTRGEISVAGDWQHNARGWWNGEILMPNITMAVAPISVVPEPGMAALLVALTLGFKVGNKRKL